MIIAHRATLAEISLLLGLFEKPVRIYIALFEQTGDIWPVSRRNGPTKLLGDCEQLILLKFIIEQPGIYLYEIKDRLDQWLQLVHQQYAGHCSLWNVHDKLYITLPFSYEGVNPCSIVIMDNASIHHVQCATNQECAINFLSLI